MNTFYQNYERETQSLDSHLTQRERSFAEQMKPVYYCGMIAKLLIHIASFCAAVIYPAYLFEILFGNFTVGLIIGFVALLIFVEIPKWASVNTFFENYFFANSRKISYGIALFALIEISISILSSTFGVPILVQKLAPSAVLLDVVEIESKFDQERQEARALYQPQIDEWTQKAESYFKGNSKKDKKTGELRLTRVSHILNRYDKYIANKEKAQAILNNKLEKIDEYEREEIEQAQSENIVRAESHQFKQNNAGLISMLIMLCLELSYIVIVCLSKYYKNRCRLEQIPNSQDETRQVVTTDKQRSQDETETNSLSHVVTQSDKQSDGENQSDSRNDIGFRFHGKIVTRENEIEPRIMYKKDDGTFAEYTQKECLTYANRKTTSEARKNKLLALAKKVTEYKTKQSQSE